MPAEKIISLTPSRRKALEILNKSSSLTAGSFAVQYYTEPRHQYLFTAVSNQGNGACAGKKAWLCAGSFLGKLAKEGLVRREYDRWRGLWMFHITEKGKDALRTSDKSISLATLSSVEQLKD